MKSDPRQVLIAGASGFLGTHLRRELVARGHTVNRLVRRAPSAADEFRWDPANGAVDPEAIGAADVVVNLAGAPTLGNPHSDRWATNLRESRVRGTAVLAEAIVASERRPAFLAGNGISAYGDHGADRLDEDTPARGDAFLTEVARSWEAAATPASEAGARVCILRTAPVMDRRSQPLKSLRLLFSLGLGGRVGDGQQYFPLISLRDWVGGVTHLVEHDSAAGAFNLCCPETPTNAEFTRALGRRLGRPTILPAPAFAVRIGAGRLSPELLGSVNAAPQALVDAGYEFRDPDVSAVLDAGLS